MIWYSVIIQKIEFYSFNKVKIRPLNYANSYLSIFEDRSNRLFTELQLLSLKNYISNHIT